jgi:hypothetical protein
VKFIAVGSRSVLPFPFPPHRRRAQAIVQI